MKRLLALLVVLVFAMSAAFALDGIVTWVRYHRYRNFSVGVSLSDHYYLIPYTSIVNRFDVRVFASKSF